MASLEVEEEIEQIDLDEESSICIGARRSLKYLHTCVTQSHGEPTPTSEEQIEVENKILGIYSAVLENKSAPLLLRDKHNTFLRRGLKRLSDAYEALDASRPWLCYWIVHSMNLLSLEVPSEEASRVSLFLSKCQNTEYGGFGGGPGQFSHLAATYAAVNALISLRTPEALSVIESESLLKFLKSMKMTDGSFRMHKEGEIDVRSVYCAVVVAYLTNLHSDELFEGTAEWIIRCQTYEGGFSGFIGGEAHGGYTFCAVAALVLLEGEKFMNRNALIRWLVNRQLPLEGGFQGRTNKLVDGCYSFWQGACFTLLGSDYIGYDDSGSPRWVFNQFSLQEYILICCQHLSGGLIDKPGKSRDYYHTCYTLSGLSIAQHSPNNCKIFLESKHNALNEVNPVYNLTVDSVNLAHSYFYGSYPPSTCTSEPVTDVPTQKSETA